VPSRRELTFQADTYDRLVLCDNVRKPKASAYYDFDYIEAFSRLRSGIDLTYEATGALFYRTPGPSANKPLRRRESEIPKAAEGWSKKERFTARIHSRCDR